MRSRSTLLTTLGLALAFTSGCTLGEVGTADDQVVGDDDDLLPAEALCESTLTMSGTFTTSVSPPPTAEEGCVPQGTWTVQVTVADVGDCDAAPVASTYTYTVTGQGPEQRITYTGTPGEELNSGIHAGGNGECEGTFEHIWAADGTDFHVAQLKPYFDPGTSTIQGQGTYQLWSSHP